MQTLPAIAFEARHVQEFVKYGFVKKNATVSKKGHITLNNQTYVVVQKEKFSRQTSTKVVVSEYNGKLLIFENQPDGIYLAEALCQGPSEKPQFNPNKDRLKSSEIDRIIFFLQEKNEHPDIISRLKVLRLYPILVEDFIMDYKDFVPQAIEQIYAATAGDMRKFKEVCADCRDKAKELKVNIIDVELVLSFIEDLLKE